MAKSTPPVCVRACVCVQVVSAVASESRPALHYFLQSHAADGYAAAGADIRQQGTVHIHIHMRTGGGGDTDYKSLQEPSHNIYIYIYGTGDSSPVSPLSFVHV